jgi:hypothetical protein
MGLSALSLDAESLQSEWMGRGQRMRWRTEKDREAPDGQAESKKAR